mmetsp:Transcript_13178/g.17372  ORF Transcript_13178/g.17372 Transcript_13178/m.17372 type:complete len:243 (+) Transcript_13178:278-1006(+)
MKRQFKKAKENEAASNFEEVPALPARRTTTPLRARSMPTSPPNAPPRGREALKLLSLNEAQWGGLILQKVWRWPDGKDYSSIGKLVQSFIQFSREIGEDGEISCVNFEVPNQQRQRMPQSINHPLYSRAMNPPLAVESMQMVCRRNSKVVVSCFYSVKNGQVTHSSTREKVEEMLQIIHESFCAQYGEILDAMKEDFRVLGDGNIQPEEIDALQQHITDTFSSFENVIDETLDLCLFSDQNV